MHDLGIINKLNAEAVARWRATPAEPHAVVKSMGLNVESVLPASSKAAADDLASSINDEGVPGQRARVI